MDEIQKVLIKEGRKDLAQKYYEKTIKTAATTNINVLGKEIDDVCKLLQNQKNDLEKRFLAFEKILKKYDIKVTGLEYQFFGNVEKPEPRINGKLSKNLIDFDRKISDNIINDVKKIKDIDYAGMNSFFIQTKR